MCVCGYLRSLEGSATQGRCISQFSVALLFIKKKKKRRVDFPIPRHLSEQMIGSSMMPLMGDFGKGKGVRDGLYMEKDD